MCPPSLPFKEQNASVDWTGRPRPCDCNKNPVTRAQRALSKDAGLDLSGTAADRMKVEAIPSCLCSGVSGPHLGDGLQMGNMLRLLPQCTNSTMKWSRSTQLTAVKNQRSLSACPWLDIGPDSRTFGKLGVNLLLSYRSRWQTLQAMVSRHERFSEKTSGQVGGEDRERKSTDCPSPRRSSA